MKHSSFDATISALDAETSALDVETSAFGAATSAIARRLFDATISALDAETSTLDAETSVLDAETSALGTLTSVIARSYRRYRRAIMENWNQDHPERYSNFHGLFVKFQFCGKWLWTWWGRRKRQDHWPRPPGHWKWRKACININKHIEVLKLCISTSANK